MTPVFRLRAALLQAAPEGGWPDPGAAYRPPAEGMGAVEPRVVVIYNPAIESAGGRKLADVKRWRDPGRLEQRVGVRRQL